MKHYPSIPKWDPSVIGEIAIAFDKIDGSNIRAEWNKKQGFYKFGSRNLLIDETHPVLGKSIDLIKTKYADDLALVCEEQEWKSAVFFFEFWGPNSFAGSHNPDDEHTVTLIDCNVYKKGLLPAEEFLWRFGHLDHPKKLFHGRVTEEFIQSVREGTLEGVTFEGVVCKYPREDSMFKVKTKAWFEKLKDYCGENHSLYAQLA